MAARALILPYRSLICSRFFKALVWVPSCTRKQTVKRVKIYSLNGLSGVWTHSSLGELVHTLLRAGSASLEHIQQSLLIRRKTNNLRNKLADELGALGELLLKQRQTALALETFWRHHNMNVKLPDTKAPINNITTTKNKSQSLHRRHWIFVVVVVAKWQLTRRKDNHTPIGNAFSWTKLTHSLAAGRAGSLHLLGDRESLLQTDGNTSGGHFLL